jgi:hypothetical protein
MSAHHRSLLGHLIAVSVYCKVYLEWPTSIPYGI